MYLNTAFNEKKSITDVGRTTKVPTIREGLDRVNRGWKQVKTGDVVSMDNEKKHTNSRKLGYQSGKHDKREAEHGTNI